MHVNDDRKINDCVKNAIVLFTLLLQALYIVGCSTLKKLFACMDISNILIDMYKR